MDFSIFNILSDGEYKLKIFPVYVRGKKIFYKFTCKKGQNTHSRLFYVKEGCLHFEMKNGEKWDLLSALAAEKNFGLTKEQIRDILRPELYIGRCTQQVEEYLIKLKPLLDGITAASVEINL